MSMYHSDIRVYIIDVFSLSDIGEHIIDVYVQPIPLGVTFLNDVSKLKAQSSNVSFHWNVAKETFELWALRFRKWHPKWDWLYHSDISVYIIRYRCIYRRENTSLFKGRIRSHFSLISSDIGVYIVFIVFSFSNIGVYIIAPWVHTYVLTVLWHLPWVWGGFD